jgi:hypothetical protein
VPEENEHFCDIDGVLFNKQKTVLIKYPAHREGDSYTVPEGVTSIGQDAFDHSILKTINLPKSLTDIGAGAFDYCYALEAIDIPAGVTNIGEMAFSECSDLTSVTCRAVEPPVLGDEVFEEYACKNIPLFVPKASLDKYKAAELWKEFAQIDSYDATVTFLDKDGNLIEEQYVVKGEGAVAPEAPEVEGYTFTGWDKDFSAVEEDMVITAQYAINTYTVRFFDIDEELLDEQTVNWNEAATAPEAPEVEGYTFTGWSEYFDHVTCDIDVYALYKLNNPGQGIEEINHNFEIINHKFIKDGQLFIVREGKIYNAQGANVK